MVGVEVVDIAASVRQEAVQAIQPVVGIAERAALSAAVVFERDQGVGLCANHRLVKFSVAKVTIFYFGAKGVGAFCEPASGETERLFYNSHEARGRGVTY